MNDKLRLCNSLRIATMAVLLTPGWPALGKEPKSADDFVRQFWADARVISLQPDKELATYHSNPSGGVGPNGTLSLGIVEQQRHFTVTIVARLKSQRFLANVTVKPDDEDTRTRAQEIDYDLSDLNPRSLEIARDEDGRIYRLQLTPRIIENPKPWQFKASDLRLESWSFPSSPVILNDQDYVGRLAMSSGPIAWCDIPGLAKIEFSLLRLKDAQPIGTLEGGVINIAHEDGTTLRISEVKNGVNAEVLGGGPYRVWVRWTRPTQSVEQHRESLKQHIASLEERITRGDLSLPAGALKRLIKMSESGRIGLIGNGLRGVEDGDLDESAE